MFLRSLKIAVFLTATSFSVASFAGGTVGSAEIGGTYKTVTACRPDNARFKFLDLMFDPGMEVSITVDEANHKLLFSAYHEDSLAMPLSNEAKIKSVIFGDYYNNAEIELTEKYYYFKTSGTELRMRSNHPFPGKHPSVETWNDELLIARKDDSQLEIRWAIDDNKGSCLLERK
ncbi:hypothetical protein [Bdellovibrio sp. HCB337]|uniref:hypothetical protein n=1 Tax=Bdellovibrio sp. HCB337 TaxID=3394358 RepID=UPI0039A74CFA